MQYVKTYNHIYIKIILQYNYSYEKKFFMLRIWLSIFNYCHHKTIMNDSSVIRDPKESLYGIKIQSKSGHECISLNDHFILIFIDLCPQMIIIGF